MTDDFEEIDLDPREVEGEKELSPKAVEDFTKIFTEIANTSTPPLNLITKDAVVVVGQVCHRRHANQPTSTTIQFVRDLETEEQPYTRLCHKEKSKATEEWQMIDTGWLENDVSILIISNDEGGHSDTNLTPEALEEIKSRVIEIGIYVDASHFSETIPIQYILPREAFPLSLFEVDDYRIRCRKGTAKYTITAYPR